MTDVIALETRRAHFAPASYNAEARTIEAVISTGAPVERRDSRGPFIERLDTSAIDLAALPGVVVLDGHRQTGSEHVIGTVVEARREGEAIVATIRLSAAEDVRSTVLKVEEGILRGVSVGYAVSRWVDSTDPTTKARVRTATAWVIREVSLVGIPADSQSQIRSSDAMTTQAAAADVTQTQQPQVETVTRAAANAQIRSIAEIAGLDATWANGQIDAEATVEAARAAAFTAMGERGAATLQIRTQIGVDHTAPSVILERQADALAARMMGSAPSDEARPYMSHSLVDLARDNLTRAGVGVGADSGTSILTRAMHTTSDFPQLLDQASNRVVMTAYGAAESPLKALANRRVVSDLRDVAVLKLGESSGLEKVTEAGEIKSVTLGEAGEGYKIETFGGILTLSRKLLLNDDMGTFGQSASVLGRAAAQTEANALVGLLTESNGAGPVMSDGKRLFHADHGNVAASGSALTIESLSAARMALRTQKGVDGKTPVGVTPKYLVVGPAQETKAEQILATLAATKVDDVNVFSNRLQLIVEPRIAGNAWYLFGDRTTAPVLEMAYVASTNGPRVDQEEAFEQLAKRWRVYLDLGVGAVDWRGAYRNAGA